MHKKVLPIMMMFFIISAAHLMAQRAAISGLVVDAETNTPLPYVNVGLTHPGSETPIKGTTTDLNGSFVLTGLDLGTYDLWFSFIGYEKISAKNIRIEKANDNVKVETIQLAISSVALDAIDVSALRKTSSTKIDRKTYQTDDFATAKGGTAVDVLNKLPSVSVSADGAVSVRGTEDFIVYLNGKPTQMDPAMLLGQISGEAIQSIDVISIPTAKYDAQGKGGIINISTKQDAIKGISISSNGMLGGAPWNHLSDTYSGFNQNDNRYGGGINLMYNKNKLALTAGFNFNHKNVNGARSGDARVLIDSENNIYQHMVAEGERPEWYDYYSANAGMDYELSKAASIAASYFYGKRHEGRSAFYIYNNYIGAADLTLTDALLDPSSVESIYNPNQDDRYGEFHTANLDYTYKPNDQSTLKISALAEFSSLDRELSNRNYTHNLATDGVGDKLLHYRQTDKTPLNSYRLAIDYAKTLGNEHVLSLGVQPQLFNIDGDFGYDTLNTANDELLPYSDLVNGIDMTRGIYAVYVDYQGAIGKLSFIAGLRMEYMDQELNINNPDYFSILNEETKSQFKVNQADWFPTLHLNYGINDKNKLAFAASRRISRPPIKNMAPFLYRRHLEVYVVGDPNLKPQYLSNLELSFDKSINKHSVNLTGFYRGTDNAIFRVNTVTTEDENPRVQEVIMEDVLIRSYTNSGNTVALGAELNANLVVSNKVKFFIGGSLYNYTVDSDLFGYSSKNSSTNFSVKANMNIILSKSFTFTADADVKSATVTAQGQNDLFYMTNCALNYSSVDLKGWSASLRVLDLAMSNSQGLDTQAFNAEGKEIFYQETTYERAGPIVELGLSYAINTQGLLKKDKKTVGDSEF